MDTFMVGAGLVIGGVSILLPIILTRRRERLEATMFDPEKVVRWRVEVYCGDDNEVVAACDYRQLLELYRKALSHTFSHSNEAKQQKH
jgi:hypothetical protein